MRRGLSELAPSLSTCDRVLVRMLSFDDERWNHLKGGYKTPFDPRPSLRKLESQNDTATAWQELWEDLHHQGDVGDASYASIPELVRIHRKGSAADWNLYAMVAIIELARTELRNPEVPEWLEWLRDDYFRSIQELAQMGTKDILSADESETKRAILRREVSRSIFRGRVVGNGAMMSEMAWFMTNVVAPA